MTKIAKIDKIQGYIRVRSEGTGGIGVNSELWEYLNFLCELQQGSLVTTANSVIPMNIVIQVRPNIYVRVAMCSRV